MELIIFAFVMFGLILGGLTLLAVAGAAVAAMIALLPVLLMVAVPVMLLLYLVVLVVEPSYVIPTISVIFVVVAGLTFGGYLLEEADKSKQKSVKSTADQ